MKYIYCIFGEYSPRDYEIHGMWTRSEKSSHKLRAFPFEISLKQLILSIKSLRLFDQETPIEIYTNKSRHPVLQQLENVNIIDIRGIYNSFRTKPMWCYQLRFEALKQVDDDFISIDNDTIFLKKPNFKLKDNHCLLFNSVNMGLFGITKKTKEWMLPKIIDKMQEKIKSKSGRAVDELAILDIIRENNMPIQTGEHCVCHYFKCVEFKNYGPPTIIYDVLKKIYS